MASFSKSTETRRKNKIRRQNRRRKSKMGKKSTLSYAELFAGMLEPQK
jgi:hypothetical protein